MTAYLGFADPHDDLLDKHLELFNEAGFQMICYCVAMSMLSVGITFDSVLGWFTIYIMFFILVINAIHVGRGLIFKAKLTFIKLKFKTLKWMRERKKKSLTVVQTVSDTTVDPTKVSKKKTVREAKVFKELAMISEVSEV